MFWQRWLFVLGLVITVFGVVFGLFSESAVFAIFHQQIDPVFFPPDFYSAPGAALIQGFQAWVYGVLGATMAGWGVFITLLAWFPFQKGEKWSWYCMALGIGLWFVVDMVVTLRFGVTFNVAFNVVLLVLAALPLAFTWKRFA